MTGSDKNFVVGEVVAMAWADEVSFDNIRHQTGLQESEVIALMRKELKPGSFVAWRKRVAGRKSKHDKPICL